MSASDFHDQGLPFDLAVLVKRRQALRVLSSAGAAALLTACGDAPSIAQSPDGATCVAHPYETAGPFPADGSNTAHGTLANVLDNSGIVRGDIRSDIAQGPETNAPGTRLDLTLMLADVNQACAPLAGYALYLWHCDADGRYSIYQTQTHDYLRGVGVADEDGIVKFTTIYPGCYRGRSPHFHFEVYPSLEKSTDYKNRILTSQLALPDAVCQQVYDASRVYETSRDNFTVSSLARDFLFSDNSEVELEAQTVSLDGDPKTGYRGRVTIGVAA